MSIFEEMFAFNLFKKAVKSAYRDKKMQEELHYKMDSPSPANLRDYCLICLARGMSNADLQVFNDYFNPTHKYAELERAIERVELGRLKSLQQFILDKTTDPDELIIKLLAVLIDFNPRPYRAKDWIYASPSTDQIGLKPSSKSVDTTLKSKLVNEHKSRTGLTPTVPQRSKQVAASSSSATENIRRILELDRLKKQQKENMAPEHSMQMATEAYTPLPGRESNQSFIAGIGLFIAVIMSCYWLSPKDQLFPINPSALHMAYLSNPQDIQRASLL